MSTGPKIKPSSASIAMLGVPFDNVTIDETAAIVQRMIASGRPHYLATANVDFLVQASEDVELRRILFDADLVVCDGMPLVWASRLLGNPLKERVAGSDLVPLMLRIAEEQHYRVYFLGGKEEVIEKAIENIRRDHPKLHIAGYYSPPFAPLLEMDHDDICRRINEARPDMCFVSFGCPKQEKWIWMNRDKIQVPMSVGVGATIDFLAGAVKRAPHWVGKFGLEWIYRLCQEPKRLFKRYAKDLWYFGFAILRQMWAMKFRPQRRRSGAEADVAIREGAQYFHLKMPDRLDALSIRENIVLIDEAVTSGKSILLCEVDCSFIDSTGAGFLVRLAKRAADDGFTLILVKASRPVRSGLGMMKLDKMFRYADSREEGLALARGLQMAEAEDSRPSGDDGLCRLVWAGELTAANAGRVWEESQAVFDGVVVGGQAMVADISGLKFVDSSGAGLMVKLKKEAIRRDIDLRFEGATGEVLNVLALTRLTGFLLGTDK